MHNAVGGVECTNPSIGMLALRLNSEIKIIQAKVILKIIQGGQLVICILQQLSLQELRQKRICFTSIFLFSIASLDSSTEKNISDVTSDDNLIVRPEYPEQKRILINVQTKIRGDCPIFLNLSSDRPSHKVSQTKAKMSDDQTEYQNP